MELYKTCEDFAKNRKSYLGAYLSLLVGGLLGAHHFYLEKMKFGFGLIALLATLLGDAVFHLYALPVWVKIPLGVGILLWLFLDMILMPFRIQTHNKQLFEVVRAHKPYSSKQRVIFNKVLWGLALLPLVFLMASGVFSFMAGFAKGISEDLTVFPSNPKVEFIE